MELAGSGQRAAGSKRSLRNRTIAALWAIVRTHGRDDAWLYAEASAEVGRLLQPGFGFTTCTDQEIGRILVRVKRALGLPVQEYGSRGRQKAEGRTQRKPKDPANVVRIATVAQFQLARALEAELHIGMDEARGIAMQAGIGPHPRTAMQVAKYTEALKAIARRRRYAAWRAEHRVLVDQLSEVQP